MWCVRREGVMGAVPKPLLFSATFFHSFVGRLCWPLVVFSLVNQISGPEMITRKTNTEERRQLMTWVPPKGSPPSQAPTYPLPLYPGLCLHKLLSFYPVSQIDVAPGMWSLTISLFTPTLSLSDPIYVHDFNFHSHVADVQVITFSLKYLLKG